MQRRQFIASGVGMLAYAGAGTAMAGQGAGGQVGAEGYTAMLNQSFNIYDRVRGVTVQLVKVKAAGSQGTGQFTLSFKGSAADGLDSGTYEVEHPATGKVLMYLDVDKRGKQGVVYRADFNLLG